MRCRWEGLGDDLDLVMVPFAPVAGVGTFVAAVTGFDWWACVGIAGTYSNNGGANLSIEAAISDATGFTALWVSLHQALLGANSAVSFRPGNATTGFIATLVEGDMRPVSMLNDGSVLIGGVPPNPADNFTGRAIIVGMLTGRKPYAKG